MKKKLYLIHAYEQVYGGLHGMEEYFLFFGTRREAEYTAAEESLNITQSYMCIMDEFYYAAEDEGLIPDSEEWRDFIDKCVDNNIDYSVWEVIGGDKLDPSRIEELGRELRIAPTTFIEKYCKE